MYIPNPADETMATLGGVMYAGRHIEYSDDYRAIRAHGRADWLLILTIGGQGRYLLHGETLLCDRGMITVLLPGTPHDYGTAPGRDWSLLWVHFMPDPAWLTWLPLPQPIPGLAVYTIQDDRDLARLHGVFDRMIDDHRRHDAFSVALAHNALEELLLCAARNTAHESSHDPRVTQVLRYMESHLDQPIALDDLARLVALSPSRLAHLFTEATGHPPMQTLIRLRMRQAARMLVYGAESIGAIALQVGYESAFHFSRQFRQVYGVSPKQYRAQGGS